ncbi:unnamed protein product [Onchocerca flexuosa]|uniref:CSRNP_N domain-containing protein n=1 Tax=Onchocerca flexuosa TaxID=387005 RepID=A0A183HGJ5_9BILA|nr:unnamed protein product [Onchocerca flexuosa]
MYKMSRLSCKLFHLFPFISLNLLSLENFPNEIQSYFKDDQEICDVIRESRKHCGCTCGILPCSPETCECSRNGIECLVDRPSFPCTCTATDCNNIFGRREFDEAVVRSHFYSTLVRTQASQYQKVCSYFTFFYFTFSYLFYCFSIESFLFGYAFVF